MSPRPCATSSTRLSGRLVLPVGSRGHQDLTVVMRDGDRWTERRAGACVFVPLVGAAGWADAG